MNLHDLQKVFHTPTQFGYELLRSRRSEVQIHVTLHVESAEKKALEVKV